MTDTRKVTLTHKGREYTVTLREVTELQPNPNNTNRGKPRGVSAIETSLQTSGAHRGITSAADGTIVAGNHTYMAAADSVVDVVIDVETDGRALVNTRRTDWENANVPAALRAAIDDNRTSELNFDLDPELFAATVAELEGTDWEIPATLYTEDEIAEAIADLEEAMVDEEQTEQNVGGKEKEINCKCPNCGHPFIMQV